MLLEIGFRYVHNEVKHLIIFGMEAYNVNVRRDIYHGQDKQFDICRPVFVSHGDPIF